MLSTHTRQIGRLRRIRILDEFVHGLVHTLGKSSRDMWCMVQEIINRLLKFAPGR